MPDGVFPSMGVLVPPAGGPQTGGQLHWGIKEVVVETSIGDQGSGSAPLQRIRRGNPGPGSGLCCGGRT